MTTKEIKKEMDVCEVNSLTYEGVVYTQNGRAWRDGYEIRVNWKTLWNEYVKGELG